jgi:hypothetical protein
MLLDPFEEQFHLPSLAVEVCNELGLECHVVGQEAESSPFVVFGSDAPDGVGIIFFCNIQRQNSNLIADDIGVLSVHWLRISALKFGIAFGPGHKECLGLMNLVKPCKIQVPAVHQIKGSSLDDELIQDVDFVGLPVCNVNETGYVSMQIQEGVHLHRSLGCAKRSPRINRQAKVYRRRVEGVNSRIQIDRQGVLSIKGSGDPNQVLRKVCVDLPRPICVCIGKSVSRYLSTSKSHVVKPGGLRSQIHFDIAQRLSISQLRKGHGKKLIEASKVLDLVMTPVFRNASREGVKGQVVHDLSENEFALVHLEIPQKSLGVPF